MGLPGFKNRKTILRVTIFTLEAVAAGLVLYMLVLPLYPRLIYGLYRGRPIEQDAAKSVEVAKAKTAEFRNSLPASDYAVSADRLIIQKIGVNAPIVESKTPEAGLAKGAWRVPESSTPDSGGNTVITGHRFKYLPPNNLTFYLLDKLAVGDIISVIWEDKDYFYRVKGTKIVPATEISILKPSPDPILTLFTCDPIYSIENRLVVIADLVEGE